MKEHIFERKYLRKKALKSDQVTCLLNFFDNKYFVVDVVYK